jgi:phosphatidate cytidylyltransferase
VTRIVSAAALIAVLFATLWLLPPWATAVLAAVVAALAGGEVAKMSGKLGANVPTVFVGIAAATLAMAFVVYERRVPGSDDDTLGAVMLALLVACGILAMALGPPSPASFGRAATLVMAPVYVGLPIGAIVWVHWVFGPAATTWLLGLIAVSDSAQYYTGRAFGRRKLAPAISPAKTVEGAIGGIVVATIAGGALARWALPEVAPAAAAVLALLLALVGIAGDLFESLLKRSAGVKDSSALIPGHGGVLDRIDSYLFAAPVFYLFLRYLA